MLGGKAERMVLIGLGLASRNPTRALAVIGRCFNIRMVLDKVNRHFQSGCGRIAWRSAYAEDYGSAHAFWLVCGDGDAGVLRARGSQPVVRPVVRGGMCIGIGLRVPSRRLAVRIGGGCLVSRRGAALVADELIGSSSRKKLTTDSE